MSRILIVEDKASLKEMLQAAIRKMGHMTDVAEDRERACSAVTNKKYDVVLTDLRLPGGSGLEVLQFCKDQAESIAVIVMTAYGTIEEAVRAMKCGAYDFIQKPVDLDHLKLLLQRAMEQGNIVRENIILREEVKKLYGSPLIIGDDKAIKDVEAEIQRVARTDATVLIQGESGTGKELIARSIHQLSLRSHNPFIAVNCAAIPETLVENELFGHEKGAYTGADSRKIGKFELADTGTLFLDEIGELPLQVQSKILRVLESNNFERVGGVQTIDVDVRIVAATNRNLQEAVTHKRFREDLFFRLSVFPIQVPPLRERMGDLKVLSEYFLRRFSGEFKKDGIQLSSSALKLLESYDWPGNVRELQNCIERAVIMADGTQIRPEDLKLSFHEFRTSEAEVSSSFDLSGSLNEVSQRAVEFVEKAKITQSLRQHNWNKSKTAQSLGVGYKSLLAKIKAYRLNGWE